MSPPTCGARAGRAPGAPSLCPSPRVTGQPRGPAAGHYGASSAETGSNPMSIDSSPAGSMGGRGSATELCSHPRSSCFSCTRTELPSLGTVTSDSALASVSHGGAPLFLGLLGAGHSQRHWDGNSPQDGNHILVETKSPVDELEPPWERGFFLDGAGAMACRHSTGARRDVRTQPAPSPPTA